MDRDHLPGLFFPQTPAYASCVCSPGVMHERPMIAFGGRSLRVTADGISCQNEQAASRSSNQLDKIPYPAPSMMDDGRLFMACSSFGDDNDGVAMTLTGLTGHGHTTIFGMWLTCFVSWTLLASSGRYLRGKMGEWRFFLRLQASSPG